MKVKDMAGLKIGKLTVIKRTEKPIDSRDTDAFWLCICDCGNEVIRRGGSLRKGTHIQTCGCGRKETTAKINKKNLLGQKFGRWTVIQEEENHILGTGYYKWLCRCDCGSEKFLTSATLLSGNSKSCGCLKIEKSRELGKNRKNKNIISDSAISRLYHQAKYRKKDFNLSSEYLNDLYIKQNKKCALSGVDIFFSESSKHENVTASLDRIDSSKGYIEGNVQWVHKIVNTMKNNLIEKDFIGWCKLIYKKSKGAIL